MKLRTGQSSLRRTKLNSGILEKVHFHEDKSLSHRTFAFEGKTAVQKGQLRLLDLQFFLVCVHCVMAKFSCSE